MLKGIICGKGGQGVITINYLLGRLASELGYRVMSAETHGMAMRGGSVATLIKIGDFSSPSIGTGEADFILSIDMDEALRNFEYLKAGGFCIINSTQDCTFPDGYRIIRTHASRTSQDAFGSTRYTGQILLGQVMGAYSRVFPETASLEILSNFEKVETGAVRAGMNSVAHIN